MQPFQSLPDNNPAIVSHSVTCPLTEEEWNSQKQGLCEINDNLKNQTKKLDVVIDTCDAHAKNLTIMSNIQIEQSKTLGSIEIVLLTYDNRLDGLDKKLSAHNGHIKENTKGLQDNKKEIEKVKESQSKQVSFTKKIFSELYRFGRQLGILSSMQQEQRDNIRQIKDEVVIQNKKISVIDEKLGTQTLYINTLVQSMEKHTNDIQAIHKILKSMDTKINNLTKGLEKCTAKQNIGMPFGCCFFQMCRC